MITLLHTADLHLGVETHGHPNPATGLNTRIEEFRDTFDEVVDYALRNGIDLFLFCGDAFHKPDPHPAADHYFAFTHSVRRLSEGSIQVVLLVGNHDLPGHPSRKHALAPLTAMRLPNVWVAEEPDARVLNTRSGPVLVAALPTRRRLGGPDEAALTRETREYLRQRIVAFRDRVREARTEHPDLPAVLAAHWHVEGARAGGERELPHGMKVVLPLEWLRDPTFDYVGLGHIHAAQTLNQQPPVVYAGSLCRINFGEEQEREDEGIGKQRGEKGFLVARGVQPGAPTTPEFVPVQRARRLLTLRLLDAAGDVTEAAIRALGAERDQLQNAIVRVVVEAREPVTHDQAALAAAMDQLGVHSWRLQIERSAADDMSRARGGAVLDRSDLPVAAAAREYWRVSGVEEERQGVLLRHFEALQREALADGAPLSLATNDGAGATAVAIAPAVTATELVTLRPVRLTVTNFLSYGDDDPPDARTLDFTPIRTACLSGPNAAGKSALLDALTFALWGQCRGTPRACIRDGAQQAEVCLDFDVGEARYRVIRTVHRTRASRVELYRIAADELENGDPLAAAGQRLTHTSLRETQEVLDGLLRVDYETFVTSTFLLQGEAGRFTALRAADRKRLLGDILGLSTYETLAGAARHRHRDADARAAQFEDDIARLSESVARRPEVEADRRVAEADLAHCQATVADAQARVAALHERLASLRTRAEHLGHREQELAALDNDLADVRTQREDMEAEVRRLGDLLARRETVEQEYMRLCRAREQAQELEQLKEQADALARRRDATLDRAREQDAALRERFEALSTRHSELEEQAAAVGRLRTQIEAAQRRLDDLGDVPSQLDAVQARRDALTGAQAEHTSERARAEQQLAKLEERLRALQRAGATCPVCNQPLRATQRDTLLAQTARDRARLDAELRTVSAARDADRDALRVADQEIQRLQERRRTAEEERQRLGLLAAGVRQAEAAAESAHTVRAERQRATEELRAVTEDTAAQVRKVEEAIGALGYDAENHHRVQQEIELVRGAEVDRARIADAEDQLATRTQSLDRLHTVLEEKLQRRAVRAQAVADLRARLQELPALEADTNTAASALATAHEAERQVIDRVATLRRESDHLAEWARELDARQAELITLREAAEAYKTLDETFGTRGAPALIIERSLPALERAANGVLDRLTDGGMRVRLSATTTTQRGTERETLDIEIFGDGPDPRPYELLSGGEKFRVDFALRVALSRLLAQRARTRLQTLVIDEGFGTQDAEGRARILEAIRAVEPDFEKILVITHVEELKDAFDYRIEVTKDSAGSHLTVVTR